MDCEIIEVWYDVFMRLCMVWKRANSTILILLNLTICDPTQVNEADVVQKPNGDFISFVFYMNLGSF